MFPAARQAVGGARPGFLQLLTTDHTVNDTPTAYAGIQFNTDGTITLTASTGDSSGAVGEWYSKGATTGIGSSYEVRLASHTGSQFSTLAAAEGTWIAISSNREWRNTVGISTLRSGNYTFELGLVGTSTAIASGSITVAADST